MKFSEDTFEGYTQSLSDTEEQRANRAISMIRDAIDISSDIDSSSCQIFVQGSYANKTNVRHDSDVDVCIMLISNFYAEYPKRMTSKDYGFIDKPFHYNIYKENIIKALKDKFGRDTIRIGNKSIKIPETTYHVNADVVPAVQYRYYNTPNSLNSKNYIEGIKYFAKDGSVVINFPKLHIKNGELKNERTKQRYKGLVRIMKNVLTDMIEEGEINGAKIKSFLIECLLWNVPDSLLLDYNMWAKTLQEVIKYLWLAIDNDEYKDWREVSEMIYLFSSDRKWTPDYVKKFLGNMYKYLEF